MDRRNFIKISLCLGCAAVAGYGGFSAVKNHNLKMKPENKFLYKSIDELPKTVRMEACNSCQLNCPACGTRAMEKEIIEKGGGFGYLKFEDFKKFVDKHNFIKEIELSNNGEIFLNPELDDIIKYAYEKGIKLSASNGVNLNTVSEKTLENLVKYKFDNMMVSIDGATPDVYKIYRRGGDLDTVLNNVRIINKFKKQYNSEFPYLAWQFILFGHNEHEIDLAKERAKELDMEIIFAANFAPDYSPLKNVKMVEEKTGMRLDEGTKLIEFQEIYKEDEMGNVNDREIYCYQLADSPQINFNGDLLGCCVLEAENFQVNVFKEGLLNALNTEKVLKAKLMLSDFNTEPFKEIPCSNCGVYWDIIKKENHPLKFS